jgi:ABC-type cobalamin/Fe3+-siderophores transport system ATPase subunit
MNHTLKAGDKPMATLSIQIDKICAGYGHGPRRTVALQDVNLTVEAGETFGLLGPNGAGQTALLACVEGLHNHYQGTVRMAGQDVAHAVAHEVRHDLAVANVNLEERRPDTCTQPRRWGRRSKVGGQNIEPSHGQLLAGE